MEIKVSKALEEVWEWKEKAYQTVAHLSLDEALTFLLNKKRPEADAIRAEKKRKAA